MNRQIDNAVEAAAIAVNAQLEVVRRIDTAAAARVEARGCALAAAAVAKRDVRALRAIESDLRVLVSRLRAATEEK